MRKEITYLVVMLLCLSIAFGTTTLTKPANSEKITGNYWANSSINDTCSASQLCTVRYFAYSTDSANTTQVLLATVLNYNVSDSALMAPNATLNTATLEDSKMYTINVSFDNTTNNVSDTSTTVIIDNTIPVAPSSMTPATQTVSKSTSLTFSSTVNSARTTNCTLYFKQTSPFSATNVNMVHSGTTCSYTGTATNDGTFTWYIQASDGTNTTNGDELQLSVESSTGQIQGGGNSGGGGGSSYQEPKKENLGQQVSSTAKSSTTKGRTMAINIKAVIDWFKSLFAKRG